ncbi:hypothetical protein, partial [Bradyrhizobium sp. CCBAU 11386]|uniref:hypothetical protein n=1 Tax=Bradyrhizobium sp. CCBAU 11386 TaxID=1630837 RepID=UPI0023030B2D
LKHAFGNLYRRPSPLKGEWRAGENFIENVAEHLYGGCIVSQEQTPDIFRATETAVPSSKYMSRQRQFSN